MNRITKTYLPSFGITFTIMMLYTCGVKLLEGTGTISTGYILELFGFVLAAELAEAVLGRINFTDRKVYIVTENVLIYGILLLFAYFGKWIPFRTGAVLQLTLVFLLVMAFLRFHFTRVSKINAEQINRMLEEREDQTAGSRG